MGEEEKKKTFTMYDNYNFLKILHKFTTTCVQTKAYLLTQLTFFYFGFLLPPCPPCQACYILSALWKGWTSYLT